MSDKSSIKSKYFLYYATVTGLRLFFLLSLLAALKSVNKLFYPQETLYLDSAAQLIFLDTKFLYFSLKAQVFNTIISLQLKVNCNKTIPFVSVTITSMK